MLYCRAIVISFIKFGSAFVYKPPKPVTLVFREWLIYRPNDTPNQWLKMRKVVVLNL